jgi:hypothetical protein
MKVPLSGERGQGKWAIIDDADAQLLVGRRVYVDRQGYAIVTIDSKSRTLQRYLLNPAFRRYVIDHINHDKLDCRRANLRVATDAQSVHNRRKSKANKSGYIGVFRHRDTNKFMARVSHQGKLYYLGLYLDPAEAARAYDKKIIELRGEYAYTNFTR